MSVSWHGTCVWAYDIGSHWDTPGAGPMWHETRGVPSFTEGLGNHPTVWTAVLMVLPSCEVIHTLCDICSAGGSDGHGGENGDDRRENFGKACQSEGRYSIEMIGN